MARVRKLLAGGSDMEAKGHVMHCRALFAALDYVIVDRCDMEVLQILLVHGTDVS